ncbi:MAG TPA: thiamine-phosphate kinase [Geminicoccus sp.]|jgi:thiamine-monophosphate kinase|uniref:thiamine-phosphate kinase n=1 Tax=Geminicoccus sp. TaxID=2024832 RepID=UPI002E3282A3|nr:thiamine-phosphate kinase [Geminicoccus sp.]HEX2525052.1 thiamine-phosphate kinase [Geminicoccus sp.]
MALGEFQMIDRLLKPLASGFAGALGLSDDAALLDPPAGRQLVIAKDAIVENVHFLSADPPATVAKKLLRQNLSDLAAMGAQPLGYLTAFGRRRDLPEEWLAAFVAGLAEDQASFGLHLLGGDTVATEGPLFFSLTILGTVRSGQALTRGGAAAGDLVCVSGSLGDGALGLQVLKGGSSGSAAADAYLVDRYRLPRPRLELGHALHGVASACMDVSDGLVGDLRHILDASRAARGQGLGATIEVGALPLSEAARMMAGAIDAALSGGDDYELLFTVPPARQERLAQLPTPVTVIGRVVEGDGVAVADQGQARDQRARGWTHF